MQSLFDKPCPTLFLAVVFFVLLVSPTVQSDTSYIKLPSDQTQERIDICPEIGTEKCPVKCFRPDPVCGSDGVTYWCGCADARCAGARVEKVGFCEVDNGGSGTAGQALLLVHIVWLVLLGLFVLFGLF